MSEEKDCSSVAGVGLRPTDEPRFAGLARFARDVLQNLWEGYDLDGGEIQDLGIKHGLIYETKFDPELHIDLHGVGPYPGDEWYVEQPWLAEFAKSSEEQCISPSEASAGAPATDDHKYSISPSPLPEGLDLAELKRVAEAATPGSWFLSGSRQKVGGSDTHSIIATVDGKEIIIASVWYDPRTHAGFHDAKFAATFDPPTILRLLSELETARLDAALSDRLDENGSPLTWREIAEKAEAHLSRALEGLGRLLSAAKLLQASSEGCAVNHYGEDFALFGMPGWLADTAHDIARASEVFATMSRDKQQ